MLADELRGARALSIHIHPHRSPSPPPSLPTTTTNPQCQRRVFLSPDFQRVVDELWYAEQYDYLAHGSHVVNQLEKIREDALAAIRMQIRTMYEQLETVARARIITLPRPVW